MDLIERNRSFAVRHPWEISRVAALRSLLKNLSMTQRDSRVLDVGCGDGFISRELFKDVHVESVTAIDTNLTEKEICELNGLNGNVTYCNDYSDIKGNKYQLVLLLDVIEHVEDDGSLVLDLANEHIVDNGHVVITAPAFQVLFGSHDKFLKHRRRYNRRALVDLVSRARLECLASGYLFLSLLPIRFVQSLWEKVVGEGGKRPAGVGAWNRHEWITKAIELTLNADARMSLALNRLSVVLPGLTVWAICRKPRS